MQGKAPRLDQELLEAGERQVAAPAFEPLEDPIESFGRRRETDAVESLAQRRAVQRAQFQRVQLLEESLYACAPRRVLLCVERGGVALREEGVMSQIEHAVLRPAAEAEVVAVREGVEREGRRRGEGARARPRQRPHGPGEQDCTDGALVELLGSVELTYLLDGGGLDKRVDWESVLSGGECQRLGFARLFYHRPRFAVMDESTSAMDGGLEARCMSKCAAMGITCVSVGHRDSLRQFHPHRLYLDGSGTAQMDAPEVDSDAY